MLTAPVFADSNQVKQSNKANIHIKGDGNTAIVDQDNLNQGCDDLYACGK